MLYTMTVYSINLEKAIKWIIYILFANVIKSILWHNSFDSIGVDYLKGSPGAKYWQLIECVKVEINYLKKKYPLFVLGPHELPLWELSLETNFCILISPIQRSLTIKNWLALENLFRLNIYYLLLGTGTTPKRFL